MPPSDPLPMLASLTFSGTPWLVPAAAFLAVALAVLAWSYRASAGHPWRHACLLLKALGLAALALCLLEPLWTGQRARPGANSFAVLADNSQGLQVADRGASRSRGEDLRALVDPATNPWQAELAGTFDVRRYLFDARLQSTSDFRELDFQGRSTAFGAALRSLRERFQGRPLAGALLLTDGNATDLPAGRLEDVRGLPPIYPVVLGRGDALTDLAVEQVRISQGSFEDAPVALQADVAAVGLAGRTVAAELVEPSGRVLQEQTAEVRGDRATLAFRFQVKPEQPGLSFYQIRVAPRGAAGAGPAEATLANNARVVAVDRGPGPFRVLYVAGRPNWEFKFLNRAVQDDPQLQLVGLIRVAKREPKFDFRGRAGETSNPLFRGFGSQSPDEVQRYDQPVLIRLNTRDEVELRAGFPRTPEELFAYHAVIIDDLEAEFFGADQAQLLQRFAGERGGGVLMLGGMECFQEGGYRRTPVGDLLPVNLDRDEGPAEPAGPVRFQLSREGWLQPWARLRDNEADERARVESMPPFAVLNRVRGLKPGASVIATVRDEQGREWPALAVQRFGRGRTGALLLGDLWRWGMRDAAAQADLAKSWRQLVRWLVTDVPARIQVTTSPVEQDANGTVRIEVRVRDARFLPVDDAAVTIEVQPVAFGTGPAPAALRLEAEPAPGEPGLYQVSYVPRHTGGFRAVAAVKGGAGDDLGRGETGWSSDLAAEEFRSLVPNTALLEDLARRTGGRVIAAAELPEFVRRLPTERAPVMEAWTRPAWHTPALLGFALACLLTEWGLRRRKGLP